MSCSCALEQNVAWEKGVRGFLDFQDAMNEKLLHELEPIFTGRDSRINLVLVNILQAAKFTVASELKVRENERTSFLSNRNRETEYFGTAVEFNSQAIISVDRARRLLAEIPQEVRDLKQPDANVLADARTAMFQSLVKFNIMPDDFREVAQIWDETTEAVQRDGAAGALAQLDENLATFTRLRSQADRGNAPHSPLPWWKYVVIGVVLGAAVFAVVACFWWTACTWVWPAISAVAPWVFGMIDRGC